MDWGSGVEDAVPRVALVTVPGLAVVDTDWGRRAAVGVRGVTGVDGKELTDGAAEEGGRKLCLAASWALSFSFSSRILFISRSLSSKVITCYPVLHTPIWTTVAGASPSAAAPGKGMPCTEPYLVV